MVTGHGLRAPAPLEDFAVDLWRVRQHVIRVEAPVLLEADRGDACWRPMLVVPRPGRPEDSGGVEAVEVGSECDGESKVRNLRGKASPIAMREDQRFTAAAPVRSTERPGISLVLGPESSRC